MRVRLVLSFVMLSVLALSNVAFAAENQAPQFAFWYEDWKADTWQRLQPANVLVGVPPNAVADIHSHGGKALAYVTFYQSPFGRDFLKDESDLQNVGFYSDGSFLKSVFGADRYVLCSNSAELRRRILAYLDVVLNSQHYDGLFVDNTYLAPATKLVCSAKHAHVGSGETGAAAYIDLLQAVYAQVKKRNPQAIVMTNPGNPAYADQLRNGNKTLWDFSDYVLWESFDYTSHSGSAHDAFTSALKQSSSVGSHSAKIVALAYPRSPEEALSSFAFARALGYRYAANIGERQKESPDASGGHFGIFLAGLPTDLGEPLSAPSERNGLLFREFSGGEVAVNSSSAVQRFPVSKSGTLRLGSATRSVKTGEKVEVQPSQSAIVTYR